MRTFHRFNRVAQASIIQPFLREIIAIRGLTLHQIAHECDIPAKGLYRLMDNQIETVSSDFFNKILCFYCAVCYTPQGHKIVLHRKPRVIH